MSRFNDTRLVGVLSLFSCVLALSWHSATGAEWTSWPAEENFDGYADGELSGIGGWTTTTNSVTITGAAKIQSGIVYVPGGKAVALSNSTANITVVLSHTNATSSATSTNMWVDFYARPVFGSAASFTNGAVAAFYFRTNSGSVVAYNGTAPGTNTDEYLRAVAGQWTRLTVHLNYSSKKWDLWVNGTNAFSQYSFYSNQVSFTNMSIVEGSTNAPSYLDSLTIRTNYDLTPFVYNLGASQIGASAAYLNAQLALATNTTKCYLYWGTTDGGTTPGSWANGISCGDVLPSATFSNQASGLSADVVYYYRACASNNLGLFWADVTHVWVAQTRSRSAWHLVSLPAEYGTATGIRALLSANTGAALADGMVTNTSEVNSDAFYIQTNDVAWGHSWLFTNGNWIGWNGMATNIPILPGMAFWLKRTANGPATDYCGLTGPKPASPTVASLNFPAGKWRVFGWPFSPASTSAGAGTTNVGWRFANRGGTSGGGIDDSDLLFAEDGGRWYLLYLNSADNKWYKQGDRINPSTVQLRPGKGYYYFHRSGAMSWTPPQF